MSGLGRKPTFETNCRLRAKPVIRLHAILFGHFGMSGRLTIVLYLCLFGFYISVTLTDRASKSSKGIGLSIPYPCA